MYKDKMLHTTCTVYIFNNHDKAINTNSIRYNEKHAEQE